MTRQTRTRWTCGARWKIWGTHWFNRHAHPRDPEFYYDVVDGLPMFQRLDRTSLIQSASRLQLMLRTCRDLGAFDDFIAILQAENKDGMKKEFQMDYHRDGIIGSYYGSVAGDMQQSYYCRMKLDCFMENIYQEKTARWLRLAPNMLPADLAAKVEGWSGHGYADFAEMASLYMHEKTLELYMQVQTAWFILQFTKPRVCQRRTSSGYLQCDRRPNKNFEPFCSWQCQLRSSSIETIEELREYTWDGEECACGDGPLHAIPGLPRLASADNRDPSPEPTEPVPPSASASDSASASAEGERLSDPTEPVPASASAPTYLGMHEYPVIRKQMMLQVRESLRWTSGALATWVRYRDEKSKKALTRDMPTDGCQFIEGFSDLHDKINKNDFDAQREILRVMDGCPGKIYRTPRGRDNNNSSWATPLHFAAFRGSNKNPAPMDIVNGMVYLHRDCLDLRNGARNTPLLLATSVGNQAYASALINALADPNLCVDTEKRRNRFTSRFCEAHENPTIDRKPSAK